jgi:cytochrome P450
MAAKIDTLLDNLDHHSEQFAANSNQIYERARAVCPVLHTSSHGGFSVLARYADVRQVLRDHETFSSARYSVEGRAELMGGVAIPPNGVRVGFIEMDPPLSRQLRAMMEPWLSWRAITGARARIAEISTWVIDGVIERGRCDAITDLAKAIPALLILDILGLPLDRWSAYGKVLHEAVAKQAGSIAGLRWLLRDLREIVDAGGFDPAGLLAAMTKFESDGAPLDVDFICELTMMLLFGGTDTTIATMGHAIRHLAEHPADRRRLISQPELMPQAVEEVFRLYSPAVGVARTVLRPVNIAGVELKPGERVMCALGSANRDDRYFDEPETFKIDRRRNAHVAFGTGIHTCLGQNLARADAQIFLDEMLRRMPEYEIDLAAVRPYTKIPLVSGYSSMPITFPPGKPHSAERGPFPHLQSPRLAPMT